LPSEAIGIVEIAYCSKMRVFTLAAKCCHSYAFSARDYDHADVLFSLVHLKLLAFKMSATFDRYN
jgi:hypothetical protein